MSKKEEIETSRDSYDNESIANSDVITKYNTAAEIVNSVIAHIITLCKTGSDISEICRAGDKLVEEKSGSVYNKKENGRKLEKGVAFPTCISVNEVCGNFSPLPAESLKLNDGDLVKIDIGAHIDGFICICSHSIVIGSDKISGKKANVLKAAHFAMEAAIRAIKPGNTNNYVTSVINKVASEFGCSMVQGVLSHQLKRHVIDGNRVIISRETSDEKVDEFIFDENEVYGVDILVSSGEGLPKESEHRNTVFKRAVETNYNLKSPIPRQFLSEVNKRFPTLPFSLNMISDEKVARLGVSECLRHNLLYSYPVMSERQGEFVAGFKCTILLLPNGNKRITGVPFTQEKDCETSHSIVDEELKNLLSTSLSSKKKKKHKQVTVS
ncbi:proliferation-associated protein 2G4 metalloprotease [Cryptosporidium ryanae]|uniref:proliferation-associated protein 2G4 metalloprotease n=1 Tax=Cryptosporidium ryanae TaxID=515981 RepID=UPI00351A65E3|nr:proliferation-associated protein 2G4 metalloprotease [Cryptosporidium ryanae]